MSRLSVLSTNSYEPPKKICGKQIVGFRTTLSSSSFIGVLWSNERDSFGNFELEASCIKRVQINREVKKSLEIMN